MALCPPHAQSIPKVNFTSTLVSVAKIKGIFTVYTVLCRDRMMLHYQDIITASSVIFMHIFRPIHQEIWAVFEVANFGT